MAGLYIHIPFCKQACHYCDFHFSTNQDKRKQLCEAIAKELRLQTSYIGGEQLETIYFGGGTPSLLSADELNIIFAAINANYRVAPNAEITLEANPDDLIREKLIELKQAGINRLSIGVQSFHNTTLQFFNRAHSGKEALNCIGLAREAGFNNLSIDLIYSVPGQEANYWKKDIEQALALQPEHISAYSLTIEEKTAFGQWQKAGKIKPLEESKSVADFDLLLDELTAEGYEHYEISNFCKPGFYSQHNSSYWKQKKYLGVGPSAHSYNGESRQLNIRNNHLYLQSIGRGEVSFDLEVLSRENKINEYIFTSIRTQWGCDLAYLQSNFNYSLQETTGLHKLMRQGLVTLNNSIATLTRKGKLLADQVAVELFASV
jgi:oxygen-independent coproporphyrinogen III oxidase